MLTYLWGYVQPVSSVTTHNKDMHYKMLIFIHSYTLVLYCIRLMFHKNFLQLRLLFSLSIKFIILFLMKVGIHVKDFSCK